MSAPLQPVYEPLRLQTPYRPMLWLAAAAGLGIVADAYLPFARDGRLFGWWWGAAALLLLVAARARRRGQFRCGAAALLATAAAIGGLWGHWHWRYASAEELARFATEEPRPACVEGVVCGRVLVSPPADRSPLRAIPAQTMSETTVELVAIRDGTAWRPAAGRSRLRVVGVLTGIGAGDRVRVFAQLARPSPPLNPGEYDWAAAERRQGRLSELFCTDRRCVALLKEAGDFGLSAAIRSLRAWCERRLTENVSPRDAPLVLATLLGDQERLPETTREAFLQTGSIHLLVVSGAHVALLAGMVWHVARGVALRRRTQLAVTIAAVVLYAAIVGPQPSVMRATILTMATFSALVRGRAASAGNLLGAAALGVMAYNPGEVFRAGTQFSFLAVAVLIVFSRWSKRPQAPDPLERLIDEARPWAVKAVRRFGVWMLGVTAASLTVGVAMAPLVAYHFNVVTPASIVLTPIAGPLIAIALTAGAGVVTVGWVVPPLGWLLGAICGGCLHLAERLVLLAQSVPGSYFYSPGFPAWWLAGFYGVAAVWVGVPAWRPRLQVQLSAALVWLAAGYVAAGPEQPRPSELRCTFLAMGHGTCVVMELPSGQTILYDAGSLGSPDAATKRVASFLWSRRIERIDAVVLSHADVDHYNAVPGLLERFPVGVIYVSPMMFDPIATGGDLTAPFTLRDAVRTASVPMQEVWMGDRLRTDDADVTIEVLHPPREGVLGRDNANSLLLLVEFAGRRVLLTGDLESPGIERVMADPPMDCDVLLAPHHGSPLSDPPGFAAWTAPEWVVMSGREPERTLPAQLSYQRTGAAVAHTAVRGAVTCVISASGVSMQAFRGASSADGMPIGPEIAIETPSQ